MRTQRLAGIVGLLFISLLTTSCLAQPLTTAPPELIGHWHGEGEISIPVLFDPSEAPTFPDLEKVPITIDLVIQEDATVTGTVGGATLQDAILASNRGDLGRSLNMATDWLVQSGTLEGAIVPDQDTTATKDFSLPFNLEDERMQGTLFWRQTGKYPYPLVRIDLARMD